MIMVRGAALELQSATTEEQKELLEKKWLKQFLKELVTEQFNQLNDKQLQSLASHGMSVEQLTTQVVEQKEFNDELT